MTAPGIGRQRCRFGSQWRSRVHRTAPSTHSGRAGRRSSRTTRSPHQWLAGPDRTGVNRASWHRTGRTIGRHPRTRHRRSAGNRRLGQPRHHIRTRRHHGSRRRLARQIRFCWRTQRSTATHRSGRLGRLGRARAHTGTRSRTRCRNTGNGRGSRRARNRNRRTGLKKIAHSRRQGLPRSRENLPRARRWNGFSGNRGSSGDRRSDRSGRSMRHVRRRYRSRHLTRQRWTQRMYRPRRRAFFAFLRRFSGRRLHFRHGLDPGGVLRMGRFRLLENSGFGGVMFAFRL